MKRTMIAIAMLLVCTAAEARSRGHHHYHHHHHRIANDANGNGVWAKPRAWCGWFARQLVGRDPGVAFNLAANWARWGRPASPAPGVMVVWAHHVGMITGRTADGRWIVKSGNDGHRVRERPRSIAGAIAFRAG